MILGFIMGLVIAHLLTFIHMDQVIISGVHDLIKVNISTSGYYFMLGMVGGISRAMIGGFFTGLLIAHILTYITVDHIVIEGVKEWFKYDMGQGVYYLLFGVLGAAVSFLKVVRMLLSPLFFLVKKKARSN